MDANKTWDITQAMMSGQFTADEDHWVTINGTHVLIGEGGEIKGGPDGIKQHYAKKSGGSGGESAKSKRVPRGRGHEIITPSDNMTKEERADLQELEYQAYEFLEERCKDNDEDFMDLWGVSEPYEEDGITYVDAEYNVVTKSGKRVDRASQVPVSPKNKASSAKPVSETSTHGKIVNQGGGQWYGENDNGSAVSILDGGKEDFNLWKFGSKQIYEVQPIDKDLNWGKKEYYATKKEATAAAKEHLKRMAKDSSAWDTIQAMMVGDFNPNHDPDDGRFTSGSGGSSGGDYDDDPEGKAAAKVSESEYYGKVGKVKYRNLEFEIDKNGNIISGPKELMEGLKHLKAPGENITQGEIVIYAPDWREPGEEKYVHVVLEERGNQCLIGTLNTRLTLGSTESVRREMIQGTGYNAGVAPDWKKYNDPDK